MNFALSPVAAASATFRQSAESALRLLESSAGLLATALSHPCFAAAATAELVPLPPELELDVEVLAAAVLAGCGGSSSSHSSSTRALSPALAAAVAQCESTISSEPGLSTSVKDKLVQGCNDIANGKKAAARRIAAETCVQVIKDAVPPAKRAAALAACPKP